MYEWFTTATTYFHSLPLPHHYQQFKDPPTIVFSLGRQRAQHAWTKKSNSISNKKLTKILECIEIYIYHTN
jgi:hypothetical protein